MVRLYAAVNPVRLMDGRDRYAGQDRGSQRLVGPLAAPADRREHLPHRRPVEPRHGQPGRVPTLAVPALGRKSRARRDESFEQAPHCRLTSHPRRAGAHAELEHPHAQRAGHPPNLYTGPTGDRLPLSRGAHQGLSFGPAVHQQRVVHQRGSWYCLSHDHLRSELCCQCALGGAAARAGNSVRSGWCWDAVLPARTASGTPPLVWRTAGRTRATRYEPGGRRGPRDDREAPTPAASTAFRRDRDVRAAKTGRSHPLSPIAYRGRESDQPRRTMPSRLSGRRYTVMRFHVSPNSATRAADMPRCATPRDTFSAMCVAM